MSLGSWDLQVAIRDRLTLGQVAGGRVFDTPQATAPNVIFPYVGLGETQILNIDVLGYQGSDEFLRVHIWDRSNVEGGQRGKKNVKRIADQIETILNGKDIAIEGRHSGFAIVSDYLDIPDPDPFTAHAVMTVRVQHFGERNI